MSNTTMLSKRLRDYACGGSSFNALIHAAADALDKLAKLEAAKAQLVQPTLLTDIDAMAKVYSSSYASPHHITFTAEGLRSMMEAAIAQIVQPAKKEQS